MKIFTADRKAANIIERFETIEDAMKAIREYEEEDKKNGDYTPDFYDIVNEDRFSLIDCPEMYLVKYIERLREKKHQLEMDLRVVFLSMEDLKSETNPNKIKKKALCFENAKHKFTETLSIVGILLSWANEYANKCMETYTISENKKRIKKYIEEINSYEEKLKYLNNLYHEQVLQTEIM